MGTGLEGRAIATDRLSKRFGHLLALDALTLEVFPGEIFGFLGPNGAGKTTAIRILLDLLRPSSGAATLFGLDCQRQGLRARAEVGYLPGELGLLSDMTGRDVLDLLARLSQRGSVAARRDELLERLRFAPKDLDRRLREYSAGMKRKLAIVQAFQARPRLLILDEPTEGLDPLVQEAFHKLLRDVQREGCTVFMSSHVLSEVERTCDRVALLRQGKMVLVAPVGEVRSLAPRRVRVSFREPVGAPKAPWPTGWDLVGIEPTLWRLAIREPLGPLVERLTGLPVADLEVEEIHLEDVLMRFFREGP